MSTMYAARFSEKVRSLVLAGAPIDTDAGNGAIKKLTQAFARLGSQVTILARNTLFLREDSPSASP